MTTKDDCLNALRDAADRLDESPTKAQYERLGLTPSSSTIQRVMGGWNDAKDEAGLETSPSRGTRVDPKPDGLELPDDLEWSELSADQRWHYRHREWNRTRTLKRRAGNRAWVFVYKRDECSCERCDEDDPACLDFHHLDSAEKEMAVGEMVTYGYSRNRIQDEIEKCSVLCANCHRKEHYQTPDGVRQINDADVDANP